MKWRNRRKIKPENLFKDIKTEEIPLLTIKFRLALYRIGKALKIDEVFFNIFHK